MKSNIGRTFITDRVLYTIVDELIITNEGYAVTFCVRNDINYPNFVIVLGLDIKSGTCDSSSSFETFESAMTELAKYRTLAKTLEAKLNPNKYHISALISAVSENLPSFVYALIENNFARKRLFEALSIAYVKSELVFEYSFLELQKLSEFCKKMWLCSDSITYEKAVDCITYLLNENILSTDELYALDEKQLEYAILDENYNIELVITV